MGSPSGRPRTRWSGWTSTPTTPGWTGRSAPAEQAGQKADRSAVDSLSNVVEQKADKTALSAAEGRIYALESGKADKTELAAQTGP